MKWAKMAVHKGHAAILDEYLAEMSYNFQNMQKDTSEYPEVVCKMALDISDVYGTEKIRKLIRDYYEYLHNIVSHPHSYDTQRGKKEL